MAPQAVADVCQHPAESGHQRQAEEAVWSPLMEEVQSTGEAATQGELTLEEEQIQGSAIGILGSDRQDENDGRRVRSGSEGSGIHRV